MTNWLTDYFITSPLAKVLRDHQFLWPFDVQCASHCSGVQFSTSQLQKCSETVSFLWHFDLQCASRYRGGRIVRHCKWHSIRLQQLFFIFWTVIFRARCSIWWCWRVGAVAPRIVNISEEDQWWESFFVAGAILVTFEGGSCFSAHCKWRFTCELGQSVFVLTGTIIFNSWKVSLVAPPILEN